MPKPPADTEHGEHTKERGCHRADADQRIHIWSTMQEAAKAVDIIRAVDIHDGQDEDELRECKCQRILSAPEDCCKARGVRDTPHGEHMAHRNIHGRQEKENGPYEPRLHRTDLLCPCVHDAFLWAGGTAGRGRAG